jgi:hypothetical protein
VIDRLRALWNRPIADHERVWFFAGAVVILVLVAVVLLATRPDDQPSAPTSSTTTTSVVRPSAVPADPVQTVTQASPGTPQANAPYAPPANAERAMHEFLVGYLRYLYGRGDAESIRRADAVLVRRLDANSPRVSPAQRERHPQIVEIRARRPRSGRVQLVATIDAGETSQYPIGALLVKRDGRWIVSEILNDE